MSRVLVLLTLALALTVGACGGAAIEDDPGPR